MGVLNLHHCIQISVIVLIHRCCLHQIQAQEILKTVITYLLLCSPGLYPTTLHFSGLKQIEKFVHHLNDMRGCKTSGGKGRLVPLEVVTVVWERPQQLHTCVTELKTSSENTTLENNDINLAAQLAFITVECTYTTNCKTLLLLGIKPVSSIYFMMTIETLQPIVEDLVNDMCVREKR